MKYILPFRLYEFRINDRVVSANDLVKSSNDEDTIKFTSPYDKIFGNPDKDFTMMIHGSPGSGKTTFLLKFAYYLSKYFGKTLYVSSEEFGSTTLVNKLKEMVADKNDKEFKLPETLFFSKGMVDLTDYKFAILDSVNDMDINVQDFKELKKIYQNTAFILVMQNTKSDDYRGGKDFEHEVDIACEIDNGIITTFKNRFGVYNSYDTFNEKFVKEDKEEE